MENKKLKFNLEFLDRPDYYLNWFFRDAIIEIVDRDKIETHLVLSGIKLKLKDKRVNYLSEKRFPISKLIKELNEKLEINLAHYKNKVNYETNFEMSCRFKFYVDLENLISLKITYEKDNKNIRFINRNLFSGASINVSSILFEPEFYKDSETMLKILNQIRNVDKLTKKVNEDRTKKEI